MTRRLSSSIRAPSGDAATPAPDPAAGSADPGRGAAARAERPPVAPEGVAAPDADRAHPHRAGVGPRACGPVRPGPTGGLRVLARHCGSALGPSASVRTGGSGGPGRDPCHRARSHRATRLHPAPRRGTARARGPRRAAGDRPRRHLGGPRGGHGERARHHRPRRGRGRGREPPAGGVPRRGSRSPGRAPELDRAQRGTHAHPSRGAVADGDACPVDVPPRRLPRARGQRGDLLERRGLAGRGRPGVERQKVVGEYQGAVHGGIGRAAATRTATACSPTRGGGSWRSSRRTSSTRRDGYRPSPASPEPWSSTSPPCGSPDQPVERRQHAHRAVCGIRVLPVLDGARGEPDGCRVRRGCGSPAPSCGRGTRP